MKKVAKLLNAGHAMFEKKQVYGAVRYYPKNELAQELVNFKRAAAQQNRKRFIKCLAQREIDSAQRMGIIMLLA